MNNTIFKICIVLALIVISLFFIIPNYSSAEGTSWKDIESSAKDFMDRGQKKGGSTIQSAETKMADIVVPIAQILVTIGTVVVVVVASVIGIKYMIANPEEKAKLKTQLIGLVVATIVIFAAQFIWRTIYSFLTDIT